jgi:undecaprenyl-phosphate galactose phosphotransferase
MSQATSTQVFHDLRMRRSVPPRSFLGTELSTCINQFGALLLLLALSPVMACVAWVIWRCDGAPIFFGHYRVGRDGRLFRCLKFRSMYRDADRMLAELLKSDPRARAEWERDQKLVNDPRITPMGRFLRKTSLDELPQLFNVLKGEMSLVGPRPVTVGELVRYGSSRWHYLSVQPGMTGLWQVSGRNNTTYDERVALDRRYVEARCLRLDISILFRTIKVVLTNDGAR